MFEATLIEGRQVASPLKSATATEQGTGPAE
jgi:hypothetical protein